jgi:hypothetical protein
MGHFINSSSAVHFHNNNSLLLDGTNDHMQIDGLANDISTTVGTVSAWVKLDSTSANGVVFKASVDTNNQIGMIYLNSGEDMRFQYKAGGTSKLIDQAFAYEGNDTWYHIMITWDTDADEMKAYVNGSAVGSTQESLGTWSGSIDAVDVGKNSLADNSYFTGHIDQVSVFASVVSATTLYNGGTPGNLTGMANLKAWYQFNEGSGTSIADSSGTGNTGTLVNGAAFNTDTP